jgi:hypothetical protein
MDPAEQLRSVTAHRDALLAEVKTLQRDKHHLRRDVETLRRELAATSSARDAAVLEAASLRRRLSTAAPRVESPGAPPPPRARQPPKPPKPISGAAQRRAASNGFGLAAPSSGFGLAPARPPRPPPIAPVRKKKKRPQSNMNGIIDGLYLTSVWNDELAADYTRALLDDVWKGNVPPVAALSGALELRAWRLAGPKADVRAWEAENQPIHPFDSGEDRRMIAARNGRKQARRRHVLDDDAEDAWAQAAQSSQIGSMGLPERSMREARVCLAKWRLAATERPCPLLPDDLFLSHVGPCLDGASLANLQASSRYFWVPRTNGIGPCAAIALHQLGQPQTFYTVAPCERLQRRLDVAARLKVLRARNKFHRALCEWKDEVRRQRAAEKAAAQRAYESAKALLEDIEKAKDACAAAKAAICVEINQCVGCNR